MSNTLPLRIMVQETWDDCALEVAPDTTVAAVKEMALERTRAASDPEDCEVKFRGALVRDESQSVEAAGMVANAQLIVLPRRRRPVR